MHPLRLGRAPNLLASQTVLLITRSNNALLDCGEVASGREILRLSENPIAPARSPSWTTFWSDAISGPGTLRGLGRPGDARFRPGRRQRSPARGQGRRVVADRHAATPTPDATSAGDRFDPPEHGGDRQPGSPGHQVLHGSAVGATPFQSLLGGIRYGGSGDGLVNDIGLGSSTPITMSGERAFGAVVRPTGVIGISIPTRPWRLVFRISMRARGLGIAGAVTVTVNGTAIDVDLADAATVEDVRLEAAIQTVDPWAGRAGSRHRRPLRDHALRRYDRHDRRSRRLDHRGRSGARGDLPRGRLHRGQIFGPD